MTVDLEPSSRGTPEPGCGQSEIVLVLQQLWRVKSPRLRTDVCCLLSCDVPWLACNISTICKLASRMLELNSDYSITTLLLLLLLFFFFFFHQICKFKNHYVFIFPMLLQNPMAIKRPDSKAKFLLPMVLPKTSRQSVCAGKVKKSGSSQTIHTISLFGLLRRLFFSSTFWVS